MYPLRAADALQTANVKVITPSLKKLELTDPQAEREIQDSQLLSSKVGINQQKAS